MKISKLLLSIAISLISFSSMADNKITMPDFAFPVKVRQSADIRYAQAIKTGDEKAALRALVDAALAQTAIAPDSAGVVANDIEHFAAECNNPDVSALAYLFTAKVYSDVYSGSRWVFDSRSLPATPTPTDIQAWDGTMFRNQINSLCDSALTKVNAAGNSPLNDYKTIITVNSDASTYFPTISDFVISYVIDLKSSLNNRAETKNIVSLYDKLVTQNANKPAPYLYFSTARLQYLRNNTEACSEQKYMAGLKELYNKFPTSQYSILPLIRIAENTFEDSNDLKNVYENLQAAVKKFPASSLSNCSKNQIKRLSQKRIEINNRNTLCPGDEIKVAIKSVNVNKGFITLYKLPDDFTTTDDYVKLSPRATKIASRTISFSGTVPFQSNDTVSFTIEQPGRYIIVPTFAGGQAARQSYPVLHVSALTLGSFIGDTTKAIVVEPISGAPVKDTEIIGFISKNGSTTTKSLGKTDANGFASLIDPFSGNIRPVKGSDRFALDSYIYKRNRREDKTLNSIKLFCDLPIYHPGDMVNWAAIAYSSTIDEMTATEGKEIKAVLYDANHNPLDTIIVTTDAFGRAAGSFEIPEGLLTGRYSIKATAENCTGTLSVLVSDYKMPTYTIDNITVENDTPQKGYTTLRGVAKTYSGVALAGIRVQLDLSTAPLWWRAAASSAPFYTVESLTDGEGKFTFIITPEDYSTANDINTAFAAKLTATSATGESVAANKRFALGTKYNLIADIPSDIDISKPIGLNVTVENVDGERVNEPVTLKILSGEKIIKEVICNKTTNLTDLSSGVYTFEFSADHTQKIKLDNIALYRPTDSVSPRKSLLWVPTHNVVNGDTILLGTANKTTHILLTNTTNNKILNQSWLTLPAGLHHIPVTLPSGNESGELRLTSIANYISANELIKIAPHTPEQRISISTETWRDRLIPGAPETITFKVSANDSSSVTAAIMLDMYNAALQTFGNHSLEFTPNKPYSSTVSFSAPKTGYDAYSSLYSNISFLNCPSISSPQLNTYDRNFGQPVRFKGTMMLSARSAGKAEMSDGAVMVTEAKMAYNAAAEVAEATVEDTDAGSSENGAAKETFDYRDANVPLAFFSPMLTTDADGRVSYSFTVPNVNTTWVLDMLGYTADMKTAYATKTAVASKPIMVSPNLPRFIRTGDEIIIESQIFNTTEKALNTSTLVEIINPQTDKVLQSEKYRNELDANGSATVSTKLIAPSDIPFICFRIKSSTDSYADGEQALIPVLPSSTPVIESTDFYIPATDRKFKIQLPEYSTDAKVILTYCDNPIWYVVTALPGLQQANPTSAIEASRNIFSAAVAQGLIKKYPKIAEALDYWKSNPSDSVLTSMLDRNSDMKSLLLASTPWMQDAQSDSERMSRLALLLDKKECESTINKAIKTLKELQNQDGGFAWMKQYQQPSLWVTTSVLTTLGNLNALGFMPDNSDLKKLIDNGLKYIEQEYSATYSKNPGSDFMPYAETVSLYPSFTPSTIGRSMISVTTQHILKEWKNISVAAKAKAALILFRTGNKATAATILQSLDEYATVSAEKGMWWQSLNDRTASLNSLAATATALTAYASISPGAPQIEKIARWLVLQKQSTNWGNSTTATEIVGAILNSAPQWVVNSGKVKIELNGKSIKTDNKNYIGEIKVNLEPQKASKSALTISKSSSSPAWGGIMSIDTKTMKSVKAADCDQLSISKKILVKDGATWKESSDLKVGDKVKISLTITSGSIIDYLAITDSRAACLEPVEQLPSPICSDGICFYRENLDSSTNIFIDRLPKGTFILEYEMWVNNSGDFSSGIATAQSQYAPEITAHSGGETLHISR